MSLLAPPASPPGVGEDEDAQQVGEELPVEHQEFRHAGVDQQVPNHFPHRSQHPSDVPGGELCEVLPPAGQSACSLTCLVA